MILYEMGRGRHPFARPDAEDFQTIRAIQSVDPLPLTEIANSTELNSVILTCLEKNPSDRYTSAAAFARRSRRS